jgi:hypothetical protein
VVVQDCDGAEACGTNSKSRESDHCEIIILCQQKCFQKCCHLVHCDDIIEDAHIILYHQVFFRIVKCIRTCRSVEYLNTINTGLRLLRSVVRKEGRLAVGRVLSADAT